MSQELPAHQYIMLEYKTASCRLGDKCTSAAGCLGSHRPEESRRRLFNGDVRNCQLAYDASEASNELERLFHPANYKREAC